MTRAVAKQKAKGRLEDGWVGVRVLAVYGEWTGTVSEAG